jgi:cystathionine beta-lyase
MSSQFDQVWERRNSDSDKWRKYGTDVLPLWVADMDFRSPEPVIAALRQRVEHGIFGYGQEPPELRPVLVEHLRQLHNWEISPEWLAFVPGIIAGFNVACRALTLPGDGLLVQTPVYHPFLRVPGNAHLIMNGMELTRRPDGQYEVDLDLFERTITGRTRAFIFCNPQNPLGRVFRRDELEQMAQICLRHGVAIVSDEIHCDLVFSGHTHLSIASLDPEIARHSITLLAPSKTYNIAGLHCSVAIIPDAGLRRRFREACADMVPGVGVMAFAASLAAYQHGQPWLTEVLHYLEANRDFLHEYVASHLPGITMAKPEGTYLAWLDCRGANLPGNPHRFFLQEARVAMNDGESFGPGGEGFVRLNFACPRSTLLEALERMRRALEAV